jgi:phosphohistidine phosphatase
MRMLPACGQGRGREINSLRDVLPHRLHVLRHAKSSWDDPELADHDRPLAPRGRRAAEALGGYLVNEEIRPTLVLCSSALRALETYRRVVPEGKLVVEKGLYAAGPDTIIERLRELPERIASAMVIGHNPALQLVVLSLADSGPVLGWRAESVDLEAIGRKFPTCALATLTVGRPWRELGPRRARLTGFVRPRDLG